MICPKCQTYSEDPRRCRRCGASLAVPVPPPPEPSPRDPGAVPWFARFLITLLCAYIFSVLAALTFLEPGWLISPWFHLVQVAVAVAGIFWFHPITNWMRDYWDHEDTNR